MENLIRQFLAINNGDGYGSGDGDGYGSGDGDGYGDGYGSGDGDGYGYGYGYGDGYGSGDGSGDGDGDGDGDGYGYGYGLKSVGKYIFHIIDGVPTAITRVRDNIAIGFILQGDLTLKPCYIVKEGNKFAHGNTLHDAFLSLQEKLYDNSTEEERIKKFLEKFPFFDKPYPAKELFAYHHILTGSCRFGRENFCRERCINIDTDSYTIEEFISLTEDHYNGHIIQQLKSFYS